MSVEYYPTFKHFLSYYLKRLQNCYQQNVGNVFASMCWWGGSGKPNQWSGVTGDEKAHSSAMTPPCGQSSKLECRATGLMISYPTCFRINHPGVGGTEPISPIPLFFSFHDYQDIDCVLKITIMFYRCRRSLVTVTHVKYECDLYVITGTFLNKKNVP